LDKLKMWCEAYPSHYQLSSGSNGDV
jgi:hypothetical protein